MKPIIMILTACLVFCGCSANPDSDSSDIYSDISSSTSDVSDNHSTEEASNYVTDSGLRYLITDGSAELLGWETESNELIIPSKINNIPVSSISDCAFYKSEKLESVEIPADITEIGKCAFYGCNNLKTINIASDKTAVGNYAFFGCPGSNIAYDFDPELEIASLETNILAGYEYGPWETIDTIDSGSPLGRDEMEASDTRQVVSAGYTIETETVSESSSTPKSKMVYHYNIMERSKTEKNESITINTYSFSKQETENGETVVKRYNNQSSVDSI